jgi:amino acid transporter
MSDIFTVSKLIPLLVFVAVGLFFIDPARFSVVAGRDLGSFSAAVFILVYAFSGFEAVLVNSGEIRQPHRVIPFALVLALGASVLLFLLIQVVCIGTLPELANSERPLADASYRFLGALGPRMISAGALVGIFGTLNVIMLACTRLPFAMAAQGQLPSPLARVHRRFRTPHVSILVSAAAALLLAFSGSFIYALKFTVITRVIVYASTCAALPVLRRRARMTAPDPIEGKAPLTFEVPAGILISMVCVILCLWLLANSGWREARDVAIAVAIGLTI